jgi:hypothetical protein
MASDTEVDKDSNEYQQQGTAQNEQCAGSPFAILVNGLEIVGERSSECLLEIGFRVRTVEHAQRLARLFRRHIAANIHGQSTASAVTEPPWLLPKSN